MHPPGQGRHDHPHRHARGALSARRPQAVGSSSSRGSTSRWCRAPAPSSSPPSSPSARSAPAEPESPRYLVKPNVKDGKGGLRDLHTLFWIAKYVYGVQESRNWWNPACSTARNSNCSAALPRIPLVGPLQHAFPDGPRRRAAVVRHSARDGGAAWLHQACRAKEVEQALVMKHYFLVAKDVGDLTAILCAALEDQRKQARPGAEPHDGEVRPRPGRQPLTRKRGLLRGQERPLDQRPRCLPRPGELDPDVSAGAEAQPGAAPVRNADRDQVAQADRRQAAGQSGGQPAVPLEILTSQNAEIVSCGG